MANQIEMSKLNRQTKEVLGLVRSGQIVELTRYGKVVARIVPYDKPDPWEGEPLPKQRVHATPPDATPDKPASWAQRNPKQASADELLKRMKK